MIKIIRQAGIAFPVGLAVVRPERFELSYPIGHWYLRPARMPTPPRARVNRAADRLRTGDLGVGNATL
jgi:hypothetical protein